MKKIFAFFNWVLRKNKPQSSFMLRQKLRTFLNNFVEIIENDCKFVFANQVCHVPWHRQRCGRKEKERLWIIRKCYRIEHQKPQRRQHINREYCTTNAIQNRGNEHMMRLCMKLQNTQPPKIVLESVKCHAECSRFDLLFDKTIFELKWNLSDFSSTNKSALQTNFDCRRNKRSRLPLQFETSKLNSLQQNPILVHFLNHNSFN